MAGSDYPNEFDPQRMDDLAELTRLLPLSIDQSIAPTEDCDRLAEEILATMNRSCLKASGIVSKRILSAQIANLCAQSIAQKRPGVSDTLPLSAIADKKTYERAGLEYEWNRRR